MIAAGGGCASGITVHFAKRVCNLRNHPVGAPNANAPPMRRTGRDVPATYHGVGHQPGPHSGAGGLVGGDVAKVQADEFVEELKRARDTGAVVLGRAAECTRLCVGTKWPWGLIHISNPAAQSKSIGAGDSGITILGNTGDLIETQIAMKAELADFIRLQNNKPSAARKWSCGWKKR